MTADQLGDVIGWNITSLLVDPSSLWEDFNIEALYSICKALDLNWVAALPDAAVVCDSSKGVS